MKLWVPALALAAALSPHVTWANCAMPTTYDVQEVSPGRVRICLRNFAGRTCPDQGLLRRNVDGSEILDVTTCDGECFVDDCVPAGTYQYGLAVPYACEPASCGTMYYVEATIAGTPGGCAHIPEVEVTKVPWGDSDTICNYGGGDHRDGGGGCGLDPSGRVVGTNVVLLLAGLAAWGWRAARRSRA